MANKTTPKIGLALSGGGARGYAHIGVIKILEQNNIPIDFIAGASAGALVGSLYCFFKDCGKVEEIILGNDLAKFINLIVDPSFEGGLIKGDKVKNFLVQTFGGANFGELEIPFRAIATDFDTAETRVLFEGDLASAVQASAAFPLVFKPVSLGEQLLWDGSLSNPVPVNAVRQMGADIVIAVNLYNKSAFEVRVKDKKEGVYEIAARAIEALQHSLAQEHLKGADIVIDPSVAGLGILDLGKFLGDRGEKIILQGEKAAVESLPKIKEAIDKFNRSNKGMGGFLRNIGRL